MSVPSAAAESVRGGMENAEITAADWALVDTWLREQRPVLDLFAGPGGWDIAATALGLAVLGVEFDEKACATRRAAGLRTLCADVAALRPADFAPVWGLIASPPCQAFSMAGKGAGRRAIAAYLAAIDQMVHGDVVDITALDEACADPRAHLVLEPLRWALALQPEWIALEQVPPVLPVWEAIATALRGQGYSVWTGVVTSERYGVPQTRERAILTASRVRSVSAIPATHRRYTPPRRKKPQTAGLFDLDAPGRIVRRDEEHLLPWVSMADALGWGMTARPSVTVTATNGDGGGPRPLDGGAHARAIVADARAVGEWVGLPRNPDRPKAGEDCRPIDEPAMTVTGMARSWLRFAGVVDTGNTRSGTRPEGRWRDSDEPAPCITTRADQLEWRPAAYNSRDQRDSRGDEPAPARQRMVDEPAPTICAASRSDTWLRVGNQENATMRNGDEPAPTLLFGNRCNRVEWTADRPATTVTTDGSGRVSAPGHHDSDESGSQQKDAVRVTLEEAAILQSFPAGYPWQGNRTETFRQVGNAIPPLLAWHVLRTVAVPT